MTHEFEIDRAMAEALGFDSLSQARVAARLAEIGGLHSPTRQETRQLLLEVLARALSEIPAANVAWSWGEFHNGGLQPLYDLSVAKDWPRLALCAADLGLAEHPPGTAAGELLSPLDALSRNLTRGIEHLLAQIQERLELAGVTP